jgi:predicted amino acid-binding ACT domain protein
MKTIILLSLALLTSCGRDYRGAVAEVNNKLANHEERISSLESQVDSDIRTINSLSSQLENLTTESASLQQLLSSTINGLQGQVTANLTTLANLDSKVSSLGNTVSEVIDPCGNGPGYDEILMKLSDGTIVAYFESGSTRFLSTLEEGGYVTTDSQACPFTVSATNEVSFQTID